MAGRKEKGKNPIQGFSQRLAEARRGQYTQEELAEIIGCSAQSIRKYESGERQPDNFEIIVNLAKTLNVTTDYLLGKDKEENSKMRDVADYIGISQKAAAKLAKLQKDERGHMLPLNGLILHRNFSVLLYELWMLHEESIGVELLAKNKKIVSNKSCGSDTLTERTISGSELLKLDLNRATETARRLFAEICMVNDACEKWDRICTANLTIEYEKQMDKS